MWGGQVTRLGVGGHLPFADLDADSLTDALRAILRPETVDRAARFAARLTEHSDATARTADIVETAA